MLSWFDVQSSLVDFNCTGLDELLSRGALRGEHVCQGHSLPKGSVEVLVPRWDLSWLVAAAVLVGAGNREILSLRGCMWSVHGICGGQT